MSDHKFQKFAKLVAMSFQSMTTGPNVFVADVNGDDLYTEYLAAFPEGTNPIFKKNTEHDCSCCKQFIRRAGAVITLNENGVATTIWDRAALDAPSFYLLVALRLSAVVRAAGVADLFRVAKNEGAFGVAQNHSLDPDNGRALTWDHFYTGDIPRDLRVALPDTERGTFRTTVQVFERGLKELTPSAVEMVVSLVGGNSLYRGEEHKPALLAFQKVQLQYLSKPVGGERDIFAWANAGNSAARFRNTVMGTLVQDLSEGKDLEHAVRSYETKVAPQNYKRTTALITPMMVKQAMKTIEELGLEPSLERRFATLKDISVNDVKWVDGAVKPLMKGGLHDTLMKATAVKETAAKDEERAEDISLDDFMSILPQTTCIELLFKNELAGNLMSLTAPVHPEPKQLFRWNNDFSWSYAGNVADSIKERVKKAGGNVTGALRVSLSWYNYDDLDLHIHEPPGRGVHGLEGHIFFGNRRGWTGGTLDVDMNVSPTTREPVENVIWPDKVPNGPYKIVVNNYNHRETSNPGFVIEVEVAGKVLNYVYNKGVRSRQDIHVCTLHMKSGQVETIDPGEPGITTSHVSQDKWGLKTEQYVKVAAVTLSPNYWGDNAYGNKHTFFVLEGAKNDEETRGFYNEFLHPRLEPHRKVFEIIGDKTKCIPTPDQLSGLGFSSTKKENFVARVQQGKKRRLFNVHVGA